MRKLTSALAAAGLLAILAVSAGPASGVEVHAAATKKVTIMDNFFSPKKITVSKGDRVKFYWGKNGKGTEVDHDVLGQKGTKFTGPEKAKGTYTSPKITKTTTVFCTIHPTTMKMTIKVK
jgi:plastocyanin